MEYYLAIKKQNYVVCRKTDLTLSKTSQYQKDKYHVFSHMQNLDLKITKEKNNDMNTGKVCGET
jgi:hypothetical protein